MRIIAGLYMLITFVTCLIVTLLVWMGVVTDLPNGLWGVWKFWVIPWPILFFFGIIGYINSRPKRYDWNPLENLDPLGHNKRGGW